MIRTFAALTTIDPGLNPHHLLTMVVSVAGAKDIAAKDRSSFYQQSLEQIQSLPGVSSASAINHLPLAGDDWNLPFFIEGRPIPRRGEGPEGTYRVVLPGYFHTMNIGLLRGRDFSKNDNQNAQRVVIVNEFLAKRYWPEQDPLGKRISLDPDGTSGRDWLTVVGVIENVVRKDWNAPTAEEVYLPFLQSSGYSTSASAFSKYMSFVVRTTSDAESEIAAVENRIRALDKTVTISEVETMDDIIADANAQPRFYLYLLTAFAAVALVLAAVGIFGVMNHSVSRRTHEMAVRMALGARQSEVMKLVLGESMLLAAVGGLVGLLVALALTPLMRTLLYGVQGTDPLTFALVAVMLAIVALLASYVPARRATLVDPVVALRCE